MLIWTALEPMSLKLSSRTIFKRLKKLIPISNTLLAGGGKQVIKDFRGGEVFEDYVKLRIADEIIFFAKTGHILAYKEGFEPVGSVRHDLKNTVMKFPIMDILMPYKILDYGYDLQSLKHSELFQ